MPASRDPHVHLLPALDARGIARPEARNVLRFVSAREVDRRDLHNARPARLPAQLRARVLAPIPEPRAILAASRRTVRRVVRVAAPRARVAAPQPERAVSVAPAVCSHLREVARLLHEDDVVGVALAPEGERGANAPSGAERVDDFGPHLGIGALGQGGDVADEVQACDGDLG